MSKVLIVTAQGAIRLPAELRRRDNIETGERFDLKRIACGEYLLRRKATSRNQGLVNLLLACPVKGWFNPLERGESTDEILVNRTR